MKYPIALFLSFLLFSCQSDQQANSPVEEQIYSSEKTHTLQAVGIKTYPIPPRIYFGFSQTQFINRNDSLLLLTWHKDQTAILVHDQQTGQWVETWEFEDDGPNGIYNARHFYYHNRDSIFFAGSYADDRIRLVDSKGIITKTYFIFGHEYGDVLESMNIYAARECLFHFENNKLDFGLYFPQDISGVKSSEDYRPFASYNILTEQLERVGPEHPAIYFEKKYVSGYKYPVRTQIDKDHWLVSFRFTSEVFVCDREGNIIKRAFVSSDYLPKIIKGFAAHPSQRDKIKLSRGSYEIIQYDPWRSVFYRHIWLPCDNTDENGYFIYTSDIPSSIIIFDMNLQKLGEFKVPKETHVAGAMFAAPEGLLISNHHRNNESHKEDEMSFTVFELVEVE